MTRQATHTKPNASDWVGAHVDLVGNVTDVYHTDSHDCFIIIVTNKAGERLATLADVSGKDANAFAMHGYYGI